MEIKIDNLLSLLSNLRMLLGIYISIAIIGFLLLLLFSVMCCDNSLSSTGSTHRVQGDLQNIIQNTIYGRLVTSDYIPISRNAHHKLRVSQI